MSEKKIMLGNEAIARGAWEAGVKVVSGSTGWLDEHGDDVRKACTEGGKTLFWASTSALEWRYFLLSTSIWRES